MDRGTSGESSLGQLMVGVRQVGSWTVVAPAGELDHHSAGMLREALDAHAGEGTPRILIDCSALEFCDSTGLNVLLATRMRVENAGGEVHLAGLRPIVARVFDITGAATVFPVHDSLDDALAALPAD